MAETAGVELLISKHGDAWRLYACGWVAPYVKAKLDQQGEALLSRAPDLSDLDRYMWNLDAPYKKQSTTLGGVQIEARGRSAIVIWEWLHDYLDSAKLGR